MKLSRLMSLLTAVALCVAVSLSMVGCDSSKTTNRSTVEDERAETFWGDNLNLPPSQKTSAPAPTKAAPRPAAGRSVAYFPSGRRDSSVLMVERIMPSQVVVGQEFDADIIVTNYSDLTYDNVVLSDICAQNFKLVSATPPPTSSANGVNKWNLGTIAPGESKTVKIRGVATAPGALKNCLTLDFTSAACLSTDVISPKLALSLEAPAEVLKCDPIKVTYTVTNTGTGNATNVVINEKLPEGLTTVDGKTSVTTVPVTLEPNKPQKFEIMLKANKAGTVSNSATASADNGLKADGAAVSTKILEPVLTIKKTGPATVFLGRTATYEIVVTNTGDGDAKGAVIDDPIPTGAKFSSATAGGALVGNTVSWKLGDLKPKDSKTVSVTIVPADVVSTLKNVSTARAYCADAVSATAETAVKGIPALLLEVADDPDPVEINGTTTYTIEVTNQGTATATNVKIVGTLEEAQEFVASGGATKGAHANRVVTFEPLPTLAPKAKAVWTVKVKALKEGDIRFKTAMTADQLGRPVDETESTNQYK